MNTVHSVIIIGSGPAGLTAALYASRADLEPLVIEGKMPGGNLMGTSIIENWPGEESISGPELMIQMKAHSEKFGTRFLSEQVTKVDFSKTPFTIITQKEKQLQAWSVIIATGASPIKLQIPGEDTYWGKGVSTCAVCDAIFYKDKDVVIVGGGDTAMESASFLTKFVKSITIVQILDRLTASVVMQKPVLNDPKVTVLYETIATAIEGDGTKISDVTIVNKKTGKKGKIPAQGVFVAIGLTPNTEPFKGQIALNKWGYIQVTDETKTSVPGVFAAGDVHDFRYKQAIVAAGSGCKAALDMEQYLKNSKKTG